MSRRWVGLCAVACVIFQFQGTVSATLAAIGGWLMLLAWVDRGALRRLRNPTFILATVVIALLSARALGPLDATCQGVAYSRQGLEAAAIMTARSAFILTVTAWATRAVRPEDWLQGGERLGVPELGAAMGTALALLPTLQARLAAIPWRQLGPRNAHRLAVEIILQTAKLGLEIGEERG